MNPAVERTKYIVAVLLYGTIGMCLRLVRVPSEIVVMCRGILGSSFILAFLAVRKKRPDIASIRRNLRWLLISGVCLGLNWVFLFSAYLHTTVAIASICNYVAPIIVVVVAPFVFKEPLNGKKIPCVIAAFAGIVLVSGFWKDQAGDFFGVLMGVMAAVCFVFILIGNRNMTDINVYDKSIAQLIISAVTVLPYVLFRNLSTPPQWDVRSVAVILMLGLIHTGVAYCLYFSSIASLPVQTVAVLGYLEPLMSVLCSAVILRERMDLFGWTGAALILGAAIVSETISMKE